MKMPKRMREKCARITRQEMLNWRPMLACGLPKGEYDYSSEEYIKEEKLDGDRCIAVIGPTGTQFFTRTISKKDGLPVEKTAWLPHLNKMVSEKRIILDGEIVVASATSNHTKVAKLFGCDVEKSLERQDEHGHLVYVVFDCMMESGEDVRSKPCYERTCLRKHAVRLLQNQGVGKFLQEVFSSKSPDFVNEVWKRGGEGIIVKHYLGTYVPDGRPAGNWMKVKQCLTVDLFISGYKEAKEESTKSDGTTSETKYKGLVGSLQLAVFDDRGKVYNVCYCSGIPDDMRRDISKNRTKYLGKVVEVKCQRVMEDQHGHISLQNPRVGQFRDDKDQQDCELSLLEKEVSA